MIQLIALDMDGTLLRDDKTFSEEFYSLVKNNKDIHFTIATGNQYELARKKFAPIQDDLIYLVENGAKLVVNNQIIYTNTISDDISNTLLHILLKYDELMIVMCGIKHAYIEKKHIAYDSFMRNYYDNIEYVDDLTQVDDQVMKYSLATFSDRYLDIVAEISNVLDPSLQLATSGHTWFDIFNKTISKGTTMTILQNYLHLSKDECAAFGDQMNDLGLIESCTYGYAMKNAIDAIKEKANYITEYDNNHDGVMIEIKKMIQN